MNPLERLALWGRFRIWAPLRQNRFSSFYSSHAQFGEDMVLRYLMNEIQDGFYVDIGAHHPVFYSNTYHFYLRGWRGLCVEAMEENLALFRVLRPRDLTAAVCLSPHSGGEAFLYVFDQPALNTMDEKVAQNTVRSGAVRLLEKRAVPTQTLGELLARRLPAGVTVDFLTIDIEGTDEAVILSHDWSVFHPRALVFEAQGADWRKLNELPSVRHLESYGYSVEAKCGPSIIMVDRAAF